MTANQSFEYVVVGAGLIGSATALYLSQISDRVAIIGPAEPPADRWGEHQGVFGSHYDQGRITRGLDADPLWSELAIASIKNYRQMEEQSGISFYHQAGALQVGPTPTKPDDYIARTQTTGETNHVHFDCYSGSAYQHIRPELCFPADYTILAEPPNLMAGYVNPRELAAAQLAIAQANGASLIRQTVTELKETAGGTRLQTDQKEAIHAERVVVAAGAWSHFLLGESQPLTLTPRTILLARLDEQEAERLKHLPSIVFYAGMTNPDLQGIYMLPPIRYPDGHIYLKIGGKLSEVNVPQSMGALNSWFKTEGSDLEAEAIKAELLSIVPGLRAKAWLRRPCMVTITDDKHPQLEVLSQGKLMVAAGGCGAAAKSCHEIGRRAAKVAREM